jgi:S1-C subfamily serine protease
MTELALSVLREAALLFFVLAPVPADPPPDPLAKGYLGVNFQDGLTIGRVEPGCPAAKAGMRPGDVVVRVGTFRPHEFREVVARICSYRPGATVEIEVERDGSRQTFKVTLTTRPPELDAHSHDFPRPFGDD